MRQKFSPKVYFGLLRAVHKVFQGREYKVQALASTWKVSFDATSTRRAFNLLTISCDREK